jgi:integrase
MPVIKITQPFIDQQLQVPGDQQRIEYCDADLPGMYIEVRSTSPDQGTFYLRYKDPTRKTCHQKIGTTKEMSLVQARNRAKELKAEIRLGSDPRGEAKARKAVPTLDAFFTEMYTPYAKPRKRSFDRDVQLFGRIGKRLGWKRLNEINRREVQTFHADLLEEGLAPATADHHAKLIRQMMNLAVEWEVIPFNPVSRLKLFHEDNRIEVNLDTKQFEQLLYVLRTDSNRAVCQVVLYLLCTGARLNEALSATWEQIDRENRVWKIPAKVSKSGKVRAVPLTDAALDVLNELTTKEGHLFVSPKTKGKLTHVHKVWDRLRKEAGLPNFRIHDCRHAFASMLVNSGHSLYAVQTILGHSSHSVTERYAHVSSRTMMEAATSASKAIQAAMAATTIKGTQTEAATEPTDPTHPTTVADAGEVATGG